MRWLIALCIWARCRGSRGTSCRRRTGLWEGILQVSGKFFRRLYSGRVLPLSLCTLHAPLELTCGTCGSAQTAIDSSCPSLDKLPSNPPPSPLRRLNLSSIYLIPSPPSCPMGRASVCASAKMLPKVVWSSCQSSTDKCAHLTGAADSPAVTLSSHSRNVSEDFLGPRPTLLRAHIIRRHAPFTFPPHLCGTQPCSDARHPLTQLRQAPLSRSQASLSC